MPWTRNPIPNLPRVLGHVVARLLARCFLEIEVDRHRWAVAEALDRGPVGLRVGLFGLSRFRGADGWVAAVDGDGGAKVGGWPCVREH